MQNPTLLKLNRYCGYGARSVTIPPWTPSAPPAPSGFLLSDLAALGVTPAYAWSLTKMSSSYSGAAIRVRRSNDSAESDIGFLSDKTLDIAALSTFCGSNQGFVKTWYDQSGNARHATQTTQAQQPIIWTGSAVTMLHGAPGLLFDGSDDGLIFPNTGAVMGNNALTMAVWAGLNNATNTAASILNQSSTQTLSSAYIWVNQATGNAQMRTFSDNLDLGNGVTVANDRNVLVWRYDPTPNPTFGTVSGSVLYRLNQDAVLNGEVAGSWGLSGAMALSTNTLAIGRRSTSFDRFAGLVMAALYIPASISNWPSVKTVLKNYWM